MADRVSNLTPPRAVTRSASAGADRSRQQTGSGAGSRVNYPSNSRRTYSSSTGWQGYEPSSGPPEYPDTSYSAYLKAGGNLLGIGYIAWRDKQLADYQTKYNLYQQWYDSTAQQMSRIVEAGLSPNLAYGMASPGSSAGGPAGMSQAPTVMDVAAQGASVLTGVADGAKKLVETASMLYELPESKFKGNLAKSLDVAAAAQAYNSGKQFEGLLNSSRLLAGAAGSQAKKEDAQNKLAAKSASIESDTLDYLTSHDSEGAETDFEGSMYLQAGAASKKDAILSYRKHKKEWDSLLSQPDYYRSVLRKAIADGDISYAQAWRVNQILNDPNMDNASKVLALQEGVPGFVSKVLFEISSKITGGVRGIFSGANQDRRNPFELPFLSR